MNAEQTRQTLLAELASLNRQREAKQEELQQIAGAERMCRHLLGKLERAAKEAAAVTPGIVPETERVYDDAAVRKEAAEYREMEDEFAERGTERP